MRKYFLFTLLLLSFSVCSGQTGSSCETAKHQDFIILKSKDISEKSGFLNTGKLSVEYLTYLTKDKVKND